MSEIDEGPITSIPKHTHATTFDNLPILDECDSASDSHEEESSDEELHRKFDKRLLVSNPSHPNSNWVRDQFVNVKDSGERTEFETGAVRDLQIGKGRYDLISPIAMKRLARHYENGAKKYEDRNWEKGIPLSKFMDSLLRHAFQFLEGDRSEDHIAAIAWNAFGLIHTETLINEDKLPESLGDLPNGK